MGPHWVCEAPQQLENDKILFLKRAVSRDLGGRFRGSVDRIRVPQKV